jgi:acetyltransferase-like isoleucine patch superfamily enzyme
VSVLSTLVTLFTSLVRLIYIRVTCGNKIKFHKFQSISLSSELVIANKSTFYLGRNVQLSKFCSIFIARNASVKIGRRVYFNQRCMISSQESITIGDNCLFGPDVKIYDNNHVFEAGVGVVHGKHKCYPVAIGNNCWVASNVVILAGTTIGDNCVIGAGVILSGTIPNNSVVKPNTINEIKKIM